MAIADEFGLYAATLPDPMARRHPWNELWPSFITMMEYAPTQAGPVSRALQPLREEIAAVDPGRQRLCLFGRLDARAMRPEELEFLMREQFDLYVIAMARAGRVNARAAADLLSQARDRGAELDMAYLKAETPMGDFMPSLHGPAAPRQEPVGRTGPTAAVQRPAGSAAVGSVDPLRLSFPDEPGHVTSANLSSPSMRISPGTPSQLGGGQTTSIRRTRLRAARFQRKAAGAAMLGISADYLAHEIRAVGA
jgi:hypothetical protein